MHNTEITTALNAWKAFFIDGVEHDAPLDDVQTLATLAYQSEDQQLHALATLCVMLEVAWSNGARAAEVAAA